MKIGIDASRAFVDKPTGTENYSAELFKALALIDRKNQYRVYVKDTRYKIPDTRNWPDKFKFVEINLPRFWTQLGLAAECFLHPPNVLFIPAHTLPIFRRPGLPTVVTIHDLGAEFLPQFHKFPQKLYLNWSTKYAVEAASAVIAVSAATKKDLIEKLGADPEKIFVVYEGVDVEKFRIMNDKLRIKKILGKYKIAKPYLLFVGTVQPRKNLVRLIEAFSSLIHNSSFSIQNLQLVIVGKLGWKYSEILKAPKKYGVENSVKFLGYVEENDLPKIYQAASVFVIPSLVEGFGLPVLEAMVAGVPVVSSAVSSLPEVAGDAALYFNPEDCSEIADVLKNVLLNDSLQKTLIEKGKKQIAKFSWEKCAKETLEVFERVKNGES